MEPMTDNKYKTVVVHHTTDDKQPPHLIINVDGIQHPVLRGRPTRLNRGAYDVLVRAKEAYPFTLIQSF